MLLKLPTRGLLLRLLAIGYGVLLMMWMSTEDHAVYSVALLGTGLAVLLVVYAVLRYYGGRRLPVRVWFPALLIGGALTGALAVICTVGLMVFKTGWHAHPYPDYPVPMMAAMMQRLPGWMLAGAACGLGVALLRVATMPTSSQNMG